MDTAAFIIAELDRGKLSEETYELVAFAAALPESLNPTIILLGKTLQDLPEEIAGKTGCPVTAITGDHLELYDSEAYCHALLDILAGTQRAWICLSHTSMGADLGPRLAVKLGAACVTSVEKVSGKTLHRSMCTGRFVAAITPQTSRVVVTVLPGAFPAGASSVHTPGPVLRRAASPIPARSRTLGISESAHCDSSLKDADVIVSAGRGLGGKENIPLIRDLAAMFPRSAVGASRSACDLGWFEYARQIGTTGQTVSPRLYIACGISGAIQHVAGMKGSQLILAINTDPDAAIFRVAHYCIVEDLSTFIPVLVEELKVRLSDGL